MSWDEPRCVWCHRTGGRIEALTVRAPNALGTKEKDVDVLAHANHEDETRRYYACLRKNVRAFVRSVLLGMVALLAFVVFNWEPGATIVLIYLGIIFIVFPFSTDTTLELMGIKNSVRLARASGVGFILSGFVLLCVAVYL